MFQTSIWVSGLVMKLKICTVTCYYTK